MAGQVLKFSIVFCTAFSLLLSPAIATQKKPSKKAQQAECDFQWNRCDQNCQDNYNWKDPNAKGDAKVLRECQDKCTAALGACQDKIKITTPPVEETGGVGKKGVVDPQ